MPTPAAYTFYNSTAWKRCREAYRERVGNLCEDCLREGRFTPAEIVHHIVPVTEANVNDPEVTLNFANLRCVCRECHAKEHGARPRRYKVDAIGRVIICE